jgi:erythronate-4-phosphate dehydrogenase
MNIVADGNIPFVKEAFSRFGTITLAPGREITREMVANAEILLVRSVTRVDKDLLENTAIKFVATATIGFDHIDLDYLAQKGIRFASAPGSNAQSVAEYIVCALCTVFDGDLSALSKKTIGVIGAGNVGSRVIRMAKALGFTCLVNDPPLEKAKGGDGFSPLDEVLQTADIVTLHVPLSKSGAFPTFHMVNERFLNKMKPGACLFNTSRGTVVDEKALLGLRSALGAVVLDVWENEPSIDMQTLAAADIATPHIAGYSYDGKVRGARMIFEAAAAFLKSGVSWNDVVSVAAENKIIDARAAQIPLLHALHSAYPILTDDRRLRKMADEINPSIYFESLRNTYPKRLEFPHFSIHCSRNQADTAGTLEKLGFTVSIDK